MPSALVIPALDELVELGESPNGYVCTTAPEFISAALKDWARRHGVDLIYI